MTDEYVEALLEEIGELRQRVRELERELALEGIRD